MKKNSIILAALFIIISNPILYSAAKSTGISKPTTQTAPAPKKSGGFDVMQKQWNKLPDITAQGKKVTQNNFLQYKENIEYTQTKRPNANGSTTFIFTKPETRQEVARFTQFKNQDGSFNWYQTDATPLNAPARALGSASSYAANKIIDASLPIASYARSTSQNTMKSIGDASSYLYNQSGAKTAYENSGIPTTIEKINQASSYVYNQSGAKTALENINKSSAGKMLQATGDLMYRYSGVKSLADTAREYNKRLNTYEKQQQVISKLKEYNTTPSATISDSITL